ncbi:MAG: hypothetical protein QXS20_06805 [Candidatus Thorarchaeota archaeon]
MKSLHHNGIIVLGLPPPHGLRINVRGETHLLNQMQEAMAVAWVKKLGTPYVEDPVFRSNFFEDFSRELGVRPSLKPEEIDFSEVINFVQSERTAKDAMSTQEKRADLERRKAERSRLKEIYGYALVDGVRMELANYQTEPAGIFMGRGQHPLRGKWKYPVQHSDITLNLSPDAPRPSGDWKEIVWSPECMWIARWTDRLTGNLKYIWLHDSTPIKQEREEAKFDKALKIGRRIDEIRRHILDGLRSKDPRRRMVAAACYLIDRLSLRVGDEKDPDEADTVGATTLRVEHLTLKDSSVVFDFLGKDSVPWHKELEMPPDVYSVFKELYEAASERMKLFAARRQGKTRGDPKKIAQIFPDIGSSHVNRFLAEVHPELTAKVFRTYHASMTMKNELAKSRVKRSDPEFVKMEAVKRANLEVARVMNHTKQAPKNWEKSERRFESRLRVAESKIEAARKNVDKQRDKVRSLRKKHERRIGDLRETIARQEELIAQYEQTIQNLTGNDKYPPNERQTPPRQSRVQSSSQVGDASALEYVQKRLEREQSTLHKKRSRLASLERTFSRQLSRAESALGRAEEALRRAEEMKSKIQTDYELAKATRTWNLTTSLKSYIHPKLVWNWCQKVDLDWHKVYSKTLQRKFKWVDTESSDISGEVAESPE